MSEPQSHGERFAQKVADDRESFSKRGSEKGEQRAEKIGESWKKGVDFFKRGMDAARRGISKVKEVGSTVGNFAKEAGTATLGAPEAFMDLMDTISLDVREAIGGARLWADKKNDQVADDWDNFTARKVGEVESSIQNIKAGRTEAKARGAEAQLERYQQRKEVGRANIESALEAAKARVAALEAQLESADGPDPEMDNLENKQADLVSQGESFRQEADNRKNNGQGLGKLRAFVSKTIAPTRFN